MDQPPSSDNSATFLALLGLMLLAGAFVLLVALVMPQVLGFVVVVMGFVGFCAMHYLLWGWWFAKPRQDDDESHPGERRESDR
jgi:threonine/homoserine/homoserine lactone efflux protein